MLTETEGSFCLISMSIASVCSLVLYCPVFDVRITVRCGCCFLKNVDDLNAYNNVRDILYDTDVITNIAKSIVHSPVGKLV